MSSSIAERVEGLREGADDYLAKPFAFEELLSLNDAQRSQAYNNRGIAYAREGQSERARADFSEAIRLAPDNAVA